MEKMMSITKEISEWAQRKPQAFISGTTTEATNPPHPPSAPLSVATPHFQCPPDAYNLRAPEDTVHVNQTALK